MRWRERIQGYVAVLSRHREHHLAQGGDAWRQLAGRARSLPAQPAAEASSPWSPRSRRPRLFGQRGVVLLHWNRPVQLDVVSFLFEPYGGAPQRFGCGGCDQIYAFIKHGPR